MPQLFGDFFFFFFLFPLHLKKKKKKKKETRWGRGFCRLMPGSVNAWMSFFFSLTFVYAPKQTHIGREKKKKEREMAGFISSWLALASVWDSRIPVIHSLERQLFSMDGWIHPFFFSLFFPHFFFCYIFKRGGSVFWVFLFLTILFRRLFFFHHSTSFFCYCRICLLPFFQGSVNFFAPMAMRNV